jgi:hypothetical protein
MVHAQGLRAMKMVAEYLEQAEHFERLAEESTDPSFKALLLQQAAAYRKLALARAKNLNNPLPKPSPQPS